MIIAKNRFGPTGFALMHFFPGKMSFEAAAQPTDDKDSGGQRPSTRGERMQAKPSSSEDMFNDETPAP